MIKHADNKPTI